jgi:hypothetical protein
MKACLNCGACVTIENNGRFYVVCPKCGMRGPESQNYNDAQAQWDNIPRNPTVSKFPDPSLDIYLKKLNK